MNALQEFKFNQLDVRVVIKDGEPWWVARDVISILGIQNPADTLMKCVDDNEKGIENIYTLGGNQNVSVINESGLYSLIFRSTKPEAKAFRKWVTSEVLPQIRKTGSYSVKELSRKDLALMIIQAEEELEKVKAVLIEQQPKVDAWQQFIDCDGFMDMVYVAQTCGVGKNRLYRKLREEKVFHYDSDHNAVYQQYIDRGYFDVRFVSVKSIGNVPVIRCTPKGAEWIYNKFYRKAA